MQERKGNREEFPLYILETTANSVFNHSLPLLKMLTNLK